MKKYRIGMDARPLSTRVSGVGRLLAETLLAFPEKDKYEFVLFTNRPIHATHWKVKELANVEIYSGSGILAKKGGTFFNFHLPRVIPKMDLDLFWGSQQVLPPFLPSNLPTVLTYCDLVLYLYPNTMRLIARLQQRFFQSNSVKNANYILSISQQTRDDVNRHFQYPTSKSAVAYPGVDAEEIESLLQETPSRQVLELMQPFLLSVSTIEPRKNYPFLLQVYRKYRAQQNAQQKLHWVIVGKRGWEKDEFFAELHKDMREHKDILWIEGANDIDLHHLYRKCYAFLFASLYEGFGIPLLEALYHNSPCIVSDIPTFHEIGKRSITYLPTTDPLAWVDSIVRLQENYQKPNAALQEFTWRHSAQITRKVFDRFLK